jgi:hypothetical protein
LKEELLMLDLRAAIVSLAVAVGVTPVAAAPAQCPTLDGAGRLELLEHAPSCDRSLELFELCSYGASGDVGLSTVVIKKCEGGFLAKLGASQRRTYEREQQHCLHKYEKEEGTMYVSFSAFCAAELARSYAHRFSSVVKP